MRTIEVTRTNINECSNMILKRIAGDGRSIQVEQFIACKSFNTNFNFSNVNITIDISKYKYESGFPIVSSHSLMVYLKPGYIVEIPRKNSKYIIVTGDGFRWKYSSYGANKEVHNQCINIIKDDIPICNYTNEMNVSNSTEMIEDEQRNVIIGMCDELYD